MFFECLFGAAKFSKDKKYCDGIYSYKGAATNSTEGIKVLNKRYDCYQTYLGISKDREYCDLLSSNETQFYDCVEKYGVNNKADYCIWREKVRLNNNISDAMSFHIFGGSKGYRKCLSLYGIPLSGSRCH